MNDRVDDPFDLRKSPTTERLREAWENNPEPDKDVVTRSGKVVTEIDGAGFDAYVWKTHNCSEAWISFEGETVEIRQ